jgi:hypothetical protein
VCLERFKAVRDPNIIRMLPKTFDISMHCMHARLFLPVDNAMRISVTTVQNVWSYIRQV